MTKLQLAQKRNYFKFVITGMFKPVDAHVLTDRELTLWKEILDNRDELLRIFDVCSRHKGLNVPEHKCWCGKPGKYDVPEDYPYHQGKVCKKHLKID